MRNLRNVRYSAWRAPSEATAVCWDAGLDEALATFGPSEDQGKIELVRIVGQRSPSQLECKAVASWDAPSPNPDLAVDRIINLHYFADTLTACLVLAGGDIVIVQEQEGASTLSAEPRIEIVGSVDAGITAARWSPDEELLVLTTSGNTVVLMSRSFDPITEASMTAEDLKASKHVSVGWGKKETQFQGRGTRARALRDPTIPEKVDEGVLGSNDDGRTSVSWRGDGAYVAINSVEQGSRRVIRVYSRDGILDSASEPVDGLEGALSWRPSGNLIAAVQRLAGRVDIVFFERNGLRHGQFTLRVPRSAETATDRICLEWNSDSTVLAVVLRDRIQLWTTGNYHWYLKQDIFTGSRHANLSWHPEKPLRFAISAGDKIVWAEYSFLISRGSLAPPHDHGAAAVIDGQMVKLTPFRTANIPPPISMFELVAESGVVDVAFSPDNASFAVLHHLGVDYYAWKTKGTRSVAPELREKIGFSRTDTDPPNVAVLQAALCGRRTIKVLQYGENPILLTYGLEEPGGWSSADASSLCSIGSFDDAGSMRGFAQDPSGKLFDISENGTEVPLHINFTTQLPQVEISRYEDQPIAFGLSRGGQLYANSRQLVRNCTSFLVTPDHLVFTTNNHLLKFVHLSSVEDLEIPPDDPETDERCRNVERGARLVTAMPTNMNLVLQMPRGNLETIYPRAMVVAGIRKLIDEKDYGKAFTFCRTQRVDMNILYDHRPEQFLRSVGLFLDQIRNVADIDLFLSSLREEDVTQVMYKNTKPSRDGAWQSPGGPTAPVGSPPSGPPSKVNSICDAILETLKLRKTSSLQNIITAHVCKSPPALDDGLLVVADMMREDESLAEKAVEHICFLVDVNRLFDHALGLYNLELTLLVAQQSQRDPREYIPFIQNLHQLPQLRLQFVVDDHLNRREKALRHLQVLNAFDELCSYTKKHALYQAAISLYRYDEPRLRTITDLYASHLEATSKFREAGLAYESIGNFAKAAGCYRAAGPSSWRECLFAAQLQTPPPSAAALSDLAGDLADALYEARDYAAAAAVHLDHLGALEPAVRCLCKGYHFADALRLVALRGGREGGTEITTTETATATETAKLLESAVDAGLADALSSSTEFLADCKAQLRAQVPRILELRRKAVEDPLSFYEGERPGGEGDVPDDVSVAASSRMSTSASLFTRYTGKGGSVGTVGSNVSRATSKNRRREEKKRARGRKGTVYEEEYLVNSVRRLVERVEGGRDEVERLAFGLVRRGMAERARAVEALASEVVEGCRVAIKEVWPPAEVTASPAGAVNGGGPGVYGNGEGIEYGYRPTGANAVLQDSLVSRNTRQEPPIVSAFSKLSLLG